MKKLPELLFSKSRPGKIGCTPPCPDTPECTPTIDQELLRGSLDHFPELSEVEVVRHYTNLSQLNHCVDAGFYPLGSCTMKYNPKVNEKIAACESFAGAHPYTPHELVQGNLQIMAELQDWLSRITGMARFTLVPAAGAHGELVGMLIVRKYLSARGDARRIVLIPDSAHGTNPASAHFAGYEIKQVPSNEAGIIDPETLSRHLDKDVAALMVTNPNTLGIFEKHISEIADMLHENGSLLYMDGANLNALLGLIRPGDLGVDIIHLNLHKTFSTPHGGGGPGSGPVGVAAHLTSFLPVPEIVKAADSCQVVYHSKKGIGRIKNFYGQFLVLVRALAYIEALGADNLRRVAEDAVLNANYLRHKLAGRLSLKYQSKTLHEVVFSDQELPVKTLDIAKRLLDYGIHPFTIYFPLIVPGAMMIEPTETESKETLDEFLAAMNRILDEALTDPQKLRDAPFDTPVRRLDETLAARKPVLKWSPENG